MNKGQEVDFYGDYVSFKLESAAKQLNRVLFYTGAILFMAVFAGLIFQAKKTNEYIDDFQNYLMAHVPYDEPLRFLLLPLLLWLILPWLPESVRFIRKYILYPKKSLTQRAFVPIDSKEIVIHPRSFRSGANPRSHYIKVRHPLSGKLIHFDVDEVFYEKLSPGTLVSVRYHPTAGKVMSMVRSPGESDL